MVACYYDVQIQINGLITFGYPNAEYTPYSFPRAYNHVAVYFADVYACPVASGSTGTVFYRITTGR